MADRQRHTDTSHNSGEYRGAPRWVKLFGVAVAFMVVLLIILMLMGNLDGHGTGRHLPPGDDRARTTSLGSAGARALGGGSGAFGTLEGDYG